MRSLNLFGVAVQASLYCLAIMACYQARMRIQDLPMLTGLPWSLWFFIFTAIVFLLQLFPLTGIFLMFVLAPLWSVILINLGMAGIGLEALVGRVSRVWLVLPLLWFGGYYLAYANDQRLLARLKAETVRFNAGKMMPFDPATQDLLFEKGKGDFHPSAFSLIQFYGLRRAFDAEGGRVHFLGDAAACAALRGNDVFRSANVYAMGFHTAGPIGKRRPVKGFCGIQAPGTPDRPVVRVVSETILSRSSWMPVRTEELTIRDDRTGREVALRTGIAAPLKRWPMLAIGCTLNSGAPSWNCSAGFLRDGFTPLTAKSDAGQDSAIVAAGLGLQRSDNLAAIASGPDVLSAYGEAADQALVAKELAILEAMLADPLVYLKDGWFYHLPNRPAIIAPYAGRIFAALGVLQTSDTRGSETGRNLWRLAAALPDEAIAPYRARLTDWLAPAQTRPWTKQTGEIYTRLDIADPVARDIVLHRLETERGDLQTSLLPPFCRMGRAAPDDTKQRLLAIWRSRAPKGDKSDRDRASNDVKLYVTLLRMGLKDEAGEVEQRYYGPTFIGIWNEVSPDTADDICALSVNDLSNRYRGR